MAKIIKDIVIRLSLKDLNINPISSYLVTKVTDTHVTASNLELLMNNSSGPPNWTPAYRNLFVYSGVMPNEINTIFFKHRNNIDYEKDDYCT